jgi:hypothetical protein
MRRCGLPERPWKCLNCRPLSRDREEQSFDPETSLGGAATHFDLLRDLPWNR